MTNEEKAALQTAILTIADPRGNWEYGWKMICDLAEADPLKLPAPFRTRTQEELARAAREDDRPRPSGHKV